MTDRRRFAVYFAPEEGSALARFGRDWLGREARTANYAALPPERAALVADARHYGFHATLKAPFRLADGADEAALHQAMAAFAAQRRPFDLPLALHDLHGFLALRPARPSAALDELAADCVRGFDHFRAALNAEERRKRLAVPLTDRQKHQVDDWGYPYVFEDFRFHMTLTRRLAEDEQAGIRALLDPILGPVLGAPATVGSLCLFSQADARTPFVLTARFPFTG
jgi:putative phosphonate metabolism protein